MSEQHLRLCMVVVGAHAHFEQTLAPKVVRNLIHISVSVRYIFLNR